MIAASRGIAAAALATALGLHAAGILSANLTEEVQLEGGAGAVVAALGSSFQDMVAGTVVPEPVEDTTAEPPQDVAPQPKPETSPPVQPPAETPQPEATQSQPPPPDSPLAPSRPDQSAEPPRPTTAAPPEPARAETPEAPPKVVSDANLPVAPAQRPEIANLPATTVQTAQPAPVAPPITPIEPSVTPATTAMPVPISSAAPLRVPEIVAAAPDAVSDGAVSRRPPAQVPERKTVSAPKPKPKTARQRRRDDKPKPKPPVKKAGNNQNKNAIQGAASGRKNAKAARQGTTGRKKQSGNAAASNYPGKVFRCINRARRSGGVGRGTAVVRFRVSSSGQLTNISLARSSGNKRLDNAAIRGIRRVGRCPAPPAGAQRSYSIKVDGQ